MAECPWATQRPARCAPACCSSDRWRSPTTCASHWIGANDVANALGTSVGSKAITVRQVVVIAAIFEFAGAFLAGGHVTATIRKGIVDPSMVLDRPELLAFGMLASLLAAAIWLMVASARGWPVSTTHTIVGAIVGFAVVGIGVDAVQWVKLEQIVASWVISPPIGGAIAYPLMLSIRRLILFADEPFQAAKRYGPLYVFLVGFIISLVTTFKGLENLDLDLSLSGSFVVATAVGAVIGVGLTRGIGAIDLRVIGTIVMSWLITLPVGAILAAVFFFTLKGIFSP